MSTKYIAPYKGVRFLESGIRNPENLSLVESGILGFGIRNKVQGIRNPLCIGIRNPSCSALPGNPESKTWNPESKTVVDSLTGGDKTCLTEQYNGENCRSQDAGLIIKFSHSDAELDVYCDFD